MLVGVRKNVYLVQAHVTISCICAYMQWFCMKKTQSLKCTNVVWRTTETSLKDVQNNLRTNPRFLAITEIKH